MAVARPILAILSLIFTGGAILLTFFVLLAGAIHGTPLDNIYFLSAETGSIPGAPGTSRWTFWNFETFNADNGNVTWGDIRPGFRFDPPTNFGTTTNVPAGFIGTNKFSLETVFAFAFILISLFFQALALMTSLVAPCARLLSRLSPAVVVIALVFAVLSAALITAAFVEGRNNFNSAGIDAQIGRYAFGFIWAVVACLIFSAALLSIGGAAGDSTTSRRSKRDRGSFIDSESARPRREYSPDE